MRKTIQTLFLCVFVLLTIQSVVFASVDDWYFTIGTYFGHNELPGTYGSIGIHPLASDGYDVGGDIALINTSTNMGIDKVEGTENWDGPTGFYSSDQGAPLPLTTGATKTWRFYVWGDSKLFLWPEPIILALIPNNIPDGGQIKFQLTLVDKPVGISDGPETGSSYNLDQFFWLHLPVFRTDNGLEGYCFDFTATVVPEPSSIVALGASLLPLGLALRRRKN